MRERMNGLPLRRVFHPARAGVVVADRLVDAAALGAAGSVRVAAVVAWSGFLVDGLRHGELALFPRCSRCPRRGIVLGQG